MDWSILGIDPTTDKKAITRAYRLKLARTNPEDKPEEFKALREAYEQALSAADAAEAVLAAVETGAEEERRYDDPVDQWEADLDAIYNTFQRRINPEEWRALLSRDVCFALDTRGLIEGRLLNYIMGHIMLSQEVWQIINERFDLLERKQELYESYPRDFVDAIIVAGIEYPNTVDGHLFEPGEDAAVCDQYVQKYLALLHVPLDEIEEPLAELLAMPEKHPMGTCMEAQARIAKGDDSGFDTLRELAERYPDSEYFILELADAYLQCDRFAECIEVAAAQREKNYENRRATWLLANAQAGAEDYAAAVETLNELMHLAGGDQKELWDLNDVRQKWNVSLIEQYEARIRENANDNQTLFDLAWCYLQNERNDEAYEMLKLLDREQLEPYEYLNLSSQTYFAVERYDEALEDSKALVEVVGAMQPDGTHKTDCRLKRYAEFVGRCGDCLFAQERVEEAMEYYDRSLEIGASDPERLSHICRVRAFLHDYDGACEMAERLINAAPGAYHGYFYMAQACFEMGNDADAFAFANRALSLEAEDLGVYILKVRILIRNNALEQARELMDWLYENGVQEDISTMWCEAVYIEAKDADYTRARELYTRMIDRMENDKQEFAWASQVYYRCALMDVQEEGSNLAKERMAELIELLDKGLEKDKRDMNCLDLKAWLLRWSDRPDEAIECYERLAASEHVGTAPEDALAQLYVKNVSRYAAKGLELYRKLLAENPDDAVYLFYAGLCAYRLELFEEAESFYLREKEVEPDCVDSYRMLGFVYLRMKRFAESAEQWHKCIAVATKNGEDKLWYHQREVQALRCAGEGTVAAGGVRRAVNLFGEDYKNWRKDLFDIYVQFGMINQAKEHIMEWLTSGEDVDGLLESNSQLGVLTGAISGARNAFRMYGKDVTARTHRTVKDLFALYAMDGDAQVEAAEEAYSDLGGTASTFEDLARAYWVAGDVTKSRAYAMKGIEFIDSELDGCLSLDFPLYESKRAVMLAYLGEYDKAFESLEQARSRPLCEQCDYCSCKDADLYEVIILLVAGRAQEALEKCRAGRQNWPRETDFVCWERMCLRAVQAE